MPGANSSFRVVFEAPGGTSGGSTLPTDDLHVVVQKYILHALQLTRLAHRACSDITTPAGVLVYEMGATKVRQGHEPAAAGAAPPPAGALLLRFTSPRSARRVSSPWDSQPPLPSFAPAPHRCRQAATGEACRAWGFQAVPGRRVTPPLSLVMSRCIHIRYWYRILSRRGAANL